MSGAVGFFAYYAVFGGGSGEGDGAVGGVGEENGLGHALVEGGDVVEAGGAVGAVVVASAAPGVVEDADDGGVAAGEDAGDATGAPGFSIRAGTSGRSFVDEDFVALHGSVELVGGDEEVVFPGG